MDRDWRRSRVVDIQGAVEDTSLILETERIDTEIQRTLRGWAYPSTTGQPRDKQLTYF